MTNLPVRLKMRRAQNHSLVSSSLSCSSCQTSMKFCLGQQLILVVRSENLNATEIKIQIYNWTLHWATSVHLLSSQSTSVSWILMLSSCLLGQPRGCFSSFPHQRCVYISCFFIWTACQRIAPLCISVSPYLICLSFFHLLPYLQIVMVITRVTS